MRHQQAPRFLISTIDVRIGGVFTAAGSSGPDHFLVNTQTGAHSHFPHNTRGWAETEPHIAFMVGTRRPGTCDS